MYCPIVSMYLVKLKVWHYKTIFNSYPSLLKSFLFLPILTRRIQISPLIHPMSEPIDKSLLNSNFKHKYNSVMTLDKRYSIENRSWNRNTWQLYWRWQCGRGFRGRRRSNRVLKVSFSICQFTHYFLHVTQFQIGDEIYVYMLVILRMVVWSRVYL